jgi:uncharacterized protein (DUF1697 family)
VTTYAALLRGVNVGGRVVPSARLRAVFEELGYDDVATYIQSGNVVFRAGGSATALTGAIEGALADTFGHPIEVVLRTGAQLGRALATNPLATHPEASLHVTFLKRRPASARVRDLDVKAFLPDEFRLAGSEVFVCCPHGYGRTKINNAYFERTLGVAATTRNVRTVGALADMTAAARRGAS